MKLLWEVVPLCLQNSEYRVLQTSPHLRETKDGFGDYVFRRPLPASASSEFSGFRIIAHGNSDREELFVKVGRAQAHRQI